MVMYKRYGKFSDAIPLILHDMKFIDSFLARFGTDIYIDLGTANTLVMDRRRGLIANEPSVIAFQEVGPNRRKIIAVGTDAKRKMGRTPGNLEATHPLREGVIADLDATEAMLRHFIEGTYQSFYRVRPNLVISLPYGVSDIEKTAVRDCAMAAGARSISLIEEPMAAAIGAGLPVESSKGSMIIDIGGGTTEVAVIALSGIVHCEAVRLGGHSFDQAIVQHIKRHFNLVIGDQSAEKLKIAVGTAVSGDEQTHSFVRGVDFATGLPREAKVTAQDVYEALSSDLDEIIVAAKRTLEKTPPELLADIIDDGVVLAGGGALLRGMDQRMRIELGIPVRITEDPLLAIARGGQRTLINRELLSNILLR